MPTTENEMNDFPLEDVLTCLNDAQLQDEHRAQDQDAETCEALDWFREAAAADGAPDTAEWIYFVSPAWTWESLCGREGWLLFDVERRTQHAFYMVVMN